ncbi:MAG TPA: hypothetical protein VGC75_01825 [Candidatus Nitrosocosmicus sp.]
MELKEFKYEQKDKKLEMLFSNGVYLASRREKNNTILLYQINSFYVEVYFYDDFCEPGYMKAFTDTEFLNPYLEQINIHFLINSPISLN